MVMLPHKAQNKNLIAINEPRVTKSLVFPNNEHHAEVAIEVSIYKYHLEHTVKIGLGLSAEL